MDHKFINPVSRCILSFHEKHALSHVDLFLKNYKMLLKLKFYCLCHAGPVRLFACLPRQNIASLVCADIWDASHENLRLKRLLPSTESFTIFGNALSSITLILSKDYRICCAIPIGVPIQNLALPVPFYLITGCPYKKLGQIMGVESNVRQVG